MFNHHAINQVIEDVVWSRSDMFSRVIPSDIDNIDCLIAFTATIIRWALLATKPGPEPVFEASVFGVHYNDAMKRIAQIRGLGPVDSELECLEIFTRHVLDRKEELIQHYKGD